MKLIVVDTEFNQPSNKIIEIGAVKVDLKTGSIDDTFQTYVDPGEDLNPEIVELTGIEQAMLNGAPGINVALGQFWEWVDIKRIGAWGNDVDELLKLSHTAPDNLEVFDVSKTIQLMRAGFVNSKAKRGGLQASLAAFEIECLGKPHNALDDARNTARLVAHLARITRVFYQVQDLTAMKKPDRSV